jgi:hypothetical protein
MVAIADGVVQPIDSRVIGSPPPDVGEGRLSTAPQRNSAMFKRIE